MPDAEFFDIYFLEAGGIATIELLLRRTLVLQQFYATFFRNVRKDQAKQLPLIPILFKRKQD